MQQPARLVASQTQEVQQGYLLWISYIAKTRVSVLVHRGCLVAVTGLELFQGLCCVSPMTLAGDLTSVYRYFFQESSVLPTEILNDQKENLSQWLRSIRIILFITLPPTLPLSSIIFGIWTKYPGHKGIVLKRKNTHVIIPHDFPLTYLKTSWNVTQLPYAIAFLSIKKKKNPTV